MRLPLLLSFALAACSSSGATEKVAAADDPASECAKRGVAYFQSIGSYPALRSPPNEGRAAEEVAIEGCQRSSAAF